MKYSFDNKGEFKPFDVTITFETRYDLHLFLNALGLITSPTGCNTTNIDDLFRELTKRQ